MSSHHTHNINRSSSPQERINAARGYKASIHNPRVSEEAKEHSRAMLAELDDEEARRELYHSGEHQKDPIRVVAGLKAAEHNPLVSEEGKHKAAEKLHEMGEDS